MKSRIKKGDKVKVLVGKDKGREGQVLSVIKKNPEDSNTLYVIVEGANIVKRNTKPVPAQQKEGGILEKEAPIHISNVAVLNKTTGKPTRIAYRVLEDGRKVRVYKSTNEEMV